MPYKIASESHINRKLFYLHHTETSDEGDFYKKNTTTGGTPVFWYRHLSSVPKRFSVFVAHEFFDVLPVHILRKTKDGWRELLVDVDEGDGPHHLRYVLSRTETPAAKLFVEVWKYSIFVIFQEIFRSLLWDLCTVDTHSVS